MSLTTGTTTATSTTSTSSTPVQTSSGGGGGGITASGSKLYLYTFLTTLLLLLGVSCAIIARSLILRRRFRRRVQEAIANGVFVPGLMDRHGGRDVGEKPVFWEVWLGQPARQMAKKVEEKESWEEVLPVSVTQLPSATASRPSASRTTPPQTQRRGFISRLFRGSSNIPATNSQSHTNLSTLESQPQPSTSEKSPETPTSSSIKTEASPVQMSLLIAMPSPAYSTPSQHHSHSSSDNRSHSEDSHSKGKLRANTSEWNGYGLEKGEIPHLEIGVLEVGYRGEPVKKSE